MGDPLDKNTDVGAINSAAQLARIRELVASGVEEGATLHQAACELPERGFWFCPTYFTDVAPAHRIAREEIFGPVLSVMTFRTPDEAVELAEQHALRPVRRRLDGQGREGVPDGAEAARAGVIWCNTFNVFDPAAPFGGMRESGFGREGGMQGLRSTCSEARGPEDLQARRSAAPRCAPSRAASRRSRRRAARTSPTRRSASRKDVRDAVRAARAALGPWRGRTAYNRGQILYRLAEVLEARTDELASVDRGVHRACRPAPRAPSSPPASRPPSTTPAGPTSWRACSAA